MWLFDYPQNLGLVPDGEAKRGEWLNNFAREVERRHFAIDDVVNGNIEYPTPYADSHSGNIKVTYRLLNVVATNAEAPALAVEHFWGFPGERPKGWYVVTLYDASTSDVLILDQVLSSTYENPTVAGYTSADVVSSTQIDGGVPTGLVGGWSNNGIVAGDEILLEGDTAFRRIETVTLGTVPPTPPPFDPDTLTLADPTPVTGSNKRYVIRRPADDTYAYIRLISSSDPFELVALIAFY